MMLINKDTVAEDDLLNRKPYAKEIVKSLIQSFQNDTNSFVFGLNGKWGCGKSTLLGFIKKLLQEELKEQKDYIFIDFNPWKFSNDANLLASFLNLFLQESASLKMKLRTLAKAGVKASKYLRYLKYIIPGADDVQQTLTDKLDELAKDPTSGTLKSEIDSLIVSKGLKIFVFIDDLDRLTPKEIVDIFQIIKLNASFKNTVFIVAYDKEVVQNALTNEYNLDGEKYLDKIIQVDYRVPDPLEEDIEQIFLETCKIFFSSTGIAYEEDSLKTLWIVFRLKHYFHTLRDIHRYFNALKTRLPAIKDEVNLYHFLAIEAIRLFDYESYEIIQSHYKADVRTRKSSDILHSLKDKLTTWTVANFIFNANLNKNIAFSISKPEYFTRYFALAVGRNDHMDAVVRHFIKNPDSRALIFEQCVEDSTIKDLLQRLVNESLDLEILRTISWWKPHKEIEFAQCVKDVLVLVKKVIECQTAPAKGISFLIELLSQDDGNFNPAKFYLFYHLNTAVIQDRSNSFAKYADTIKAYRTELQTKEIDFLKKHENDHLTFTRWDHKSDFIHKLFLEEYARLLPQDYEKKAKVYVSRRDGVLIFIRFLVKETPNQTYVLDHEVASKILTGELLELLRLESLKIDPSSLFGINLVTFEAFQTLKPKLQKLITGSEW